MSQFFMGGPSFIPVFSKNNEYNNSRAFRATRLARFCYYNFFFRFLKQRQLTPSLNPLSKTYPSPYLLIRVSLFFFFFWQISVLILFFKFFRQKNRFRPRFNKVSLDLTPCKKYICAPSRSPNNCKTYNCNLYYLRCHRR